MVATTASAPAISVRELRVDYGDFVAVDDLSLEFGGGEIVGLVGPNGAGKTSTFKVLATLMDPTYGEASLCGVDLLEDREAARRILGYMPDLAPVPSDLRVGEFLDFYAQIHQLGDRGARRERLEECLDLVGLMDKKDSWCKELSRGQTQRIVLAKTMLHRPRVLVLDEPASGLDPLARRELRVALRTLADDGATILISSHILSELAEVCTSLAIMHRGKLLASGSTDAVLQELGNDRGVAVRLTERVDEAVLWLGEREGVSEVEREEGTIRFQLSGGEAEQVGLLRELVGEGFPVRSFEERGSSFEEILIDIAEGEETDG